MKRFFIALALISASHLCGWFVPYSLDVDWNKGKRTYLLVSPSGKEFDFFQDEQDFKNKSNNQLSIKPGAQEEYQLNGESYFLKPISYQEAGKIVSQKPLVWVNENDIKAGVKARGGQIISAYVTDLFDRIASGSLRPITAPVVLPAVRTTWGAASNNSLFPDAIYANKPTTRGFEQYYCFMNTYPEGATGLSNKGPAPITLGLYFDKGRIGNPINTWRHAEAYYQAMKLVYPNDTYDDAALQQALSWDAAGSIMNIYSKYKGRVSNLRSDWQTINLFIMLDLVRAKFMQNQNMKDVLLATGNKYIVEETTDRSDVAKDSFFGNEVGRYDAAQKRWITDSAKQPGMGSNILGQILMHVRKELQAGKLLDLTLYTEPIDFFSAEKGVLVQPVGKIWSYKATDSALKPADIPLLIPQAIPTPVIKPSQPVQPISQNLTQAFNGLAQALQQLSNKILYP